MARLRPREVERDRAREGRPGGRHRRRPAEPGRVGRDRGEEGGRAGRRAARARSDAFYPFPDGIEAAAAAGRRGGRPARRRDARRREHRRAPTSSASRWCSPANGTSCTDAQRRRACAMMPGAPVAEAVFADARAAHRGARASAAITPGLGTILVGDDPRERGLHPHEAGEGGRARHRLAARTTCRTTRRRPTCVAAIRAFNDDPAVDAMLVQHPTPPQIDYEAALLEIDPDKDVDGLHPVNMGRLALGDAGPGAVHARRHRGAARALRDPGRGPRGRASSGAGTTLGRPLALLLVAEAADRQRGGHRRAHRRAGLARRTRAGPTSWSPPPACPGILQPEHVTPGRGRRGRRRPLRGPQAAARRRRALRGGRGLDHAPRRWRRPDDDRDAVPQRRRGRRAASGADG